MPEAIKPTPLTNAQLNKLLCESKTRRPVREILTVEAGSIRKLTAAEVSEWRGKTAVSEAAKRAVDDLYEAKVMQADKKNQNARIYTRKNLRDNIARLKPLLDGGQLIGTAGHPGDEEYAGDPGRISKKWVDLEMKDDGSIIGTFSVVPTKPHGENLKTILDNKLAALGFSSYGYGAGHEPSADERAKYGLGEDEECTIMDDCGEGAYELCQIDSVRGPSVKDAAVVAYPENAVADNKKSKLAEACETGLHWQEFGQCGHMLNECECEAERKHAIYADRKCETCAKNDSINVGMTIAEFKKSFSESKPARTPVSEAKSREPLAKTFAQYIKGKDSFTPAGPIKLAPTLAPDVYNIVDSWDGIKFVRQVTQTDELYSFEGSATEAVLKEIDNFWDQRENYQKYGVMYHRGIIMHGPPGTGKSAAVNQAVEMVTARGDVVFYGRNVSTLMEGLQAFREVEPDRRAVVVLEDADEYVGYQERAMLNLLDGANSIENVCYLATTNYLNRFPERLLRPGRFDKKVYVGPPAIAGRKAYLTHKLGKVETTEEIERLAKETEGLSFGHLRELITAVYALKEPKADVLARLKKTTVARDARLPAQTPVSENKQNPIRETEMDIKTLSELKDKAPAIHAEHEAIVKAANEKAAALEAANAKLREAVNPLIAGLKDVAGVVLPERQVLPAEVAERTKALEARIAALETEAKASVAKEAAAVAKAAELQAVIDGVARTNAILAKALPILKDNSYAKQLRVAIKAKIASDAKFAEADVEKFITDTVAVYDEIAEAAGGRRTATVEAGKGKSYTDDELNDIEDAQAENAGSSGVSSALSEAIPSKK